MSGINSNGGSSGRPAAGLRGAPGVAQDNGSSAGNPSAEQPVQQPVPATPRNNAAAPQTTKQTATQGDSKEAAGTRLWMSLHDRVASKWEKPGMVNMLRWKKFSATEDDVGLMIARDIKVEQYRNVHEVVGLSVVEYACCLDAGLSDQEMVNLFQGSKDRTEQQVLNACHLKRVVRDDPGFFLDHSNLPLVKPFLSGTHQDFSILDAFDKSGFKPEVREALTAGIGKDDFLKLRPYCVEGLSWEPLKSAGLKQSFDRLEALNRLLAPHLGTWFASPQHAAARWLHVLGEDSKRFAGADPSAVLHALRTDTRQLPYLAAGWNAQHARLLQAQNIPACTASERRLFQVPSMIEEIGSGAFNKVFRSVYCPGGSIDLARPMAVKYVERLALSDGRIGLIETFGASRARPRFAERNLATSQLGKLICERCKNAPAVLAPVELTTIRGRAPAAPASSAALALPAPPASAATQDDEHLVMAMPLVSGAFLKEFGKEHFDAPDLRKKLVWLQLLDGLAGQIDRHDFNIIVDHVEGTGRYDVSGIDHDQSWGTNEHALAFNKDLGPGPRGWPPVVDTDMQNTVLALKPDDLRNILEPLLPEALPAACRRLADVQEILRGKKIPVIQPDQWHESTATQWLAKPKRSYVGRNVGHWRHAELRAAKPVNDDNKENKNLPLETAAGVKPVAGLAERPGGRVDGGAGDGMGDGMGRGAGDFDKD